MAKRAHKSGSYEDPLTWMLGGLLDLGIKVTGTLLDLLLGAILKGLDKPVEALVKRLPHR